MDFHCFETNQDYLLHRPSSEVLARAYSWIDIAAKFAAGLENFEHWPLDHTEHENCNQIVAEKDLKKLASLERRSLAHIPCFRELAHEWGPGEKTFLGGDETCAKLSSFTFRAAG